MGQGVSPLLFVMVLSFSAARDLSNQRCLAALCAQSQADLSHTCRSFPLPFIFPAVSNPCCQLITIHAAWMIQALSFMCVYFFLTCSWLCSGTKDETFVARLVSLAGFELVPQLVTLSLFPLGGLLYLCLLMCVRSAWEPPHRELIFSLSHGLL